MSKPEKQSVNEDWPDSYAKKSKDIPASAQVAMLYREKNSYRGISNHTQLLKLKARQVNKEFLDEICEMKQLVDLRLDVVTAPDLAPLRRLTSLTRLHIEGIRKAQDLSPLATMKWLETLSITHAKYFADLSIFSSAHNLKFLGVEGSMWTNQKVENL